MTLKNKKRGYPLVALIMLTILLTTLMVYHPKLTKLTRVKLYPFKRVYQTVKKRLTVLQRFSLDYLKMIWQNLPPQSQRSPNHA